MILCFSNLKANADVQTTTQFQIFFVTGSTLCFQDSIGRNITLQVTSGTLNSSNGILNFQTQTGVYYLGGLFAFTSLNSATIQIKYSMIGVTLRKNQIDQKIQYGDNFTIASTDYIVLTWLPQYKLPELISGAYAIQISDFMVLFIMLLVPSSILGLYLHKFGLGVIGFLVGLNITSFLTFQVGYMPIYFVFAIIITDVLIGLGLMRSRGYSI
jgi:hypothetical protein